MWVGVVCTRVVGVSGQGASVLKIKHCAVRIPHPCGKSIPKEHSPPPQRGMGSAPDKLGRLGTARVHRGGQGPLPWPAHRDVLEIVASRQDISRGSSFWGQGNEGGVNAIGSAPLPRGFLELRLQLLNFKSPLEIK